MSALDQLKKHLSNLSFAFGHHPGKNREEAAYVYIGPPEEVAPGVFHFYSVANSVTFICGDRLMHVDCNLDFKASEVIQEIRKRTLLPFDTLAITHGHVDHCLGTYLYIRDNLNRGYGRPRVIGHGNLKDRIHKNQLLEGHRLATDKRQFQIDFEQPDVFVYPDVEFQERFEFRLGDQTFLLVFGHGHTEDSLWIYHPERKVLVCGDLFQWTAPNVGNPFKMQRFALENAVALEEMAGLDSEVLCPGHGPVIYGRETIKTCLLTAARYLHHIQDHVVACLNKGMILEETIAGLTMPEDLMNSKWLPPMYGHPVFIAKGIYKRYAGYYSGHPAELFPPRYANLSKEVLNLAGGPSPLIQKARSLHSRGEMELACQLAEWVVEGDPDCREGWELYGLLFKERADREFNIQARGCWNSAVRKAVAALERLEGIPKTSP
jgi:glyoxylase-like metal-dependent hydrolase (beta-lactamase superfamily II)